MTTATKSDNKFAKKLASCRTEEAVKSAFVRHFKLEFNMESCNKHMVIHERQQT
jgi:hypothetical protein